MNMQPLLLPTTCLLPTTTNMLMIPAAARPIIDVQQYNYFLKASGDFLGIGSRLNCG